MLDQNLDKSYLTIIIDFMLFLKRECEIYFNVLTKIN